VSQDAYKKVVEENLALRSQYLGINFPMQKDSEILTELSRQATTMGRKELAEALDSCMGQLKMFDN
jgi:hypothetical protein